MSHYDCEAAAMRRWRTLVFSSTWLSYWGFYFCRKAFYGLKSSLGQDLDISATELGDIGFVYLTAYTLGQFISAALGHKHGPRVLLLSGMAVSACTNIAFGFADNKWTLMTFMAINGLAQATGWSGNVGTMAAWTTRGERGVVMGFWSTCFQVGGAMATAWAAFWLHNIGWRGAFFTASAVLTAVWLYFYAAQRNRPEDVGLPPLHEDEGEQPEDQKASPEPSQASSMAGIPEPLPEAEPELDDGSSDWLWNRSMITTILLVGSFYFFVKFIRYALWSWTPFFLENNFGLRGDEAGYLSTVFDICGFFGTLTAGILSDKLFSGRRATISMLMLVGMVAGCGLLVWVGQRDVWFFGLAIGVVGFMLFGPDSLLTGAGAMDIGSRRAALAAAGIINGMGSLGSIVQEAIVGRLFDESRGEIGPVLELLFGASLVSLAIISIVVWRNRRGYSDL